MRILPKDARNALFVYIAEIEHIRDPDIHPGENAINFPRTLELLEKDAECVAAVQAPGRDSSTRLIASEIQHPIGRGRLTRHMQLGSYRPVHRHLLSPPPQWGMASYNKRHLTPGAGLHGQGKRI
jgi:hypothetical protein